MKIRFALSAPIAIAICLCWGCKSGDTANLEEFTPAPAIRGTPRAETLYIAPIKDSRSTEHRLPEEPDANPLILIPLWPYVYAEICPIVRYTFLRQPYPEALRDMIAKDLQASGLFKTVAVSAPTTPLAAYTLELELEKTAWRRYLTAYGLSYPGTALWALGLPVSYGDVILELKVTLKAPDGKALVSRRLSYETGCVEWIYDQVNYCPPKSEFRLAELTLRVNADLRATLEKGVSER